jgi:hypothetical protein
MNFTYLGCQNNRADKMKALAKQLATRLGKEAQEKSLKPPAPEKPRTTPARREGALVRARPKQVHKVIYPKERVAKSEKNEEERESKQSKRQRGEE